MEMELLAAFLRNIKYQNGIKAFILLKNSWHCVNLTNMAALKL